jgi:hypothetical protein
MALHMVCSHWLVCGWMLSLIVGTGVAIYQRQMEPRAERPRPAPLEWSFASLSEGKWDGGWARYADLRGRIDEERLQIGRSGGQGIAGTWRGCDGSGWSYG